MIVWCKGFFSNFCCIGDVEFFDVVKWLMFFGYYMLEVGMCEEFCYCIVLGCWDGC